MIYFNSDYLEGAHPSVMARLNETNMVQTVGYGEDEYCAAAGRRSAPSARRRRLTFTSWWVAPRPTPP